MSVSLPVAGLAPTSSHSHRNFEDSAPRIDLATRGYRVVEESAERASTGWEQVVVSLTSERGEQLTRYALALCGNPHDAQDLVQDALVKTFGRLRNGFGIDSAEAYVRKVILNSYLDRSRRRQLWHRISHLAAEPTPTESPVEEIDSRTDLIERLKLLSPRERACIVLRYLEDQKVDDVAASLGLSSGSVKRYLSDALRKLQISFSQSEEDGR
ncbi:MAG: sigma-70 family RNA polymerase sigma factor [Cryobacterium sp.]|nr:sigma-70 family RNA polymerase sigma factor [Cryobacterium sp.]